MERPPDNERSRPGEKAAPTVSTAISTETSVPNPIDVLGDLDALAEHLRGKFVVQTQTDGDRYRTHVYMTAKAAENAVRRGNARGKHVHVALCQLLPVGVVVGLASGRR